MNKQIVEKKSNKEYSKFIKDIADGIELLEKPIPEDMIVKIKEISSEVINLGKEEIKQKAKKLNNIEKKLG